MRCNITVALLFGFLDVALAFTRSGRQTSILKKHIIQQSSSKLRNSDKDYIQTMKSKLLGIGATTNRGECANQQQVDSALDLITQLESMNPLANEADGSEYSIEGCWDLVFTDAQLFESSPFFVTVRELFGDNEKAKQSFMLHRQATNTGEIGLVQQVLTSSQLKSNVDVRNGLIPGFPISLRGKIVSTAELTIIDRYSMKLIMKDTSVQNSNIPGIGSLLSAVSLPVGTIMKSLMGDLPECFLSTFYLDGDLRITRNKDDNVFVYLKSSAVE